ncbi:TPA_asm: hypothetical protein GHQ17_15025, partial [Listeria monocytogenes]|nr:hypothetical protein [Listeria monocytogenes]
KNNVLAKYVRQLSNFANYQIEKNGNKLKLLLPKILRNMEPLNIVLLIPIQSVNALNLINKKWLPLNFQFRIYLSNREII